MTSAERFLVAMRNGVPDRVPVAPDTSNYIPARRTGLPFWDIYFKGVYPLWKAYLDTADYFGMEAWMASCTGTPLLPVSTDATVECVDTLDRARDAMVRVVTTHTPLGALTERHVCFRGDPPSPVEKPIKDLVRDFPIWNAARSLPRAIDMTAWNGMRDECRRRGHAFGVCMGYPGFQIWNCFVQDGLLQLTVADLETPEILQAWLEWDIAYGKRLMELLIEARPDYILLGGSGTITLASPKLARKYALPGLKLFSRMAREAGIPTMLHSCGKSRVLVDMLADDTDVNCVNPLEIAPMGDVDLAEVKRARGRQISLMGNLHTTEVMLYGTPQTVAAAACQAMQDAGAGGGFILSTGDQCGRDTPDANMFALVETARRYGNYDPATGFLPDL